MSLSFSHCIPGGHFVVVYLFVCLFCLYIRFYLSHSLPECQDFVSLFLLFSLPTSLGSSFASPFWLLNMLWYLHCYRKISIHPSIYPSTPLSLPPSPKFSASSRSQTLHNYVLCRPPFLHLFPSQTTPPPHFQRSQRKGHFLVTYIAFFSAQVFLAFGPCFHPLLEGFSHSDVHGDLFPSVPSLSHYWFPLWLLFFLRPLRGDGSQGTQFSALRS